MHKWKRLLTLFLVMLCTLTCLSATAFAEERIVKIMPQDVAAVSTHMGTKASEDYGIWGQHFWLTKAADGTYFMKSDVFDVLPQDEKLDILTEFIHALNQWDDVSNTTRQAIYMKLNESIDDLAITALPELIEATSADLTAGYMFWLPFNGAFGIFLGVAVVILVLILVLTTIVDLVYVGTPSIIINLVGTERPWFVSRDAVAVVELEATGKMGNAYVAYFKRRFITYIILAICILYLISGQLSDIIGWFLNVGEAIVD